MWNLEEQEGKLDVKARIRLLSSLQSFMEDSEEQKNIETKYGPEFVSIMKRAAFEKIQELLGEKLEKEINRIDYTVASIQNHLKFLENAAVLSLLEKIYKRLSEGPVETKKEESILTPPPSRPRMQEDGLSPDERQAKLKQRFLDQRGSGMY